MKYSKLFMAAGTALVLGAVSLVPIANAASDEVAKSAGGVSYVSGGVGTTSIERLNALSADFNLKLVFALKSGDYVDGVQVGIADAAGKALVEAKSEGPWFLTKLPAGNFQITATFAGKTEKRSVTIGADKLRTVDFRWASE
jgi:hypothetical protein